MNSHGSKIFKLVKKFNEILNPCSFINFNKWVRVNFSNLAPFTVVPLDFNNSQKKIQIIFVNF